MNKLVFFLGVMTYIFAINNTVYAGELNEHEQAIIEAASEVYEYKGESYQVGQNYLDQLTEYLKRDNIDITPEDKELIIHWALDNIELGVKDGYLIPINNTKNQGEQLNTSKASNTSNTGNTSIEFNILDTFKYILESTSKDIPNIEGPLPSLIKGDDITGNTPSKEDDSKVLDNRNNNIEAFTNTNNDSMEDEIIKQTGFNLNITLYTIIGIGILMLVGIFIAIKNNYFSDNAYE